MVLFQQIRSYYNRGAKTQETREQQKDYADKKNNLASLVNDEIGLRNLVRAPIRTPLHLVADNKITLLTIISRQLVLSKAKVNGIKKTPFSCW